MSLQDNIVDGKDASKPAEHVGQGIVGQRCCRVRDLNDKAPTKPVPIISQETLYRGCVGYTCFDANPVVDEVVCNARRAFKLKIYCGKVRTGTGHSAELAEMQKAIVRRSLQRDHASW